MALSRFFGSFSRHRRSNRWTDGGVSAGTAVHAGSLFSTEASDVGDVFAVERAAPGQHLEQHDAERPDVGAAIDGLAARLLGRHVRGRPEDHADLGPWRVPGVSLAVSRRRSDW